jgi:acyl carrier protein
MKMETLEVKDIENFIRKKIAGALKIDPEDVNISTSFESYGIDSITAVRMVGELEEFLDVELPATLLWEYNNIQKLSNYLISLSN